MDRVDLSQYPKLQSVNTRQNIVSATEGQTTISMFSMKHRDSQASETEDDI
jgi:hypothetical protein